MAQRRDGVPFPADSKQDMMLEGIQRELASMWEEIEENDEWIDDFRPPEDVQNAVADVREIQIRLRLLESSGWKIWGESRFT